MKTLHIYKHPPDEVTSRCAEAVQGEETREFRLYEDSPDYERLIELLFECDRVVTWF